MGKSKTLIYPGFWFRDQAFGFLCEQHAWSGAAIGLSPDARAAPQWRTRQPFWCVAHLLDTTSTAIVRHGLNREHRHPGPKASVVKIGNARPSIDGLLQKQKRGQPEMPVPTSTQTAWQPPQRAARPHI